MEIKYDDDLRQCRYCGHFGHLIGKCETKAADDEVNQQWRAGNRKTTLTKSREVLATEFDTEIAKINQHFDDELTTLADVHEASLIAIKGTEGCHKRKSRLDEVFIEDQLQMHGMLQDTIQFLTDDIAERLEYLDSQYEWSGGILPPNTADEDSNPLSRTETDDEMDEDNMVNCLEDRLTTRLLTTRLHKN